MPWSGRIPVVEGLCAEQIRLHVADARSTDAILLDGFGQSHALRERLVIGRDPGEGLAVLEVSISRRHALLECVDGTWYVQDLDSTNGTWIDGRRVRERQALADGQLVVFGDVGFVFLEDGASAEGKKRTESFRRTAKLPTRGQLRLVEPARGGGALAYFGEHEIQLGLTQYALLALLAERWEADTDQSGEVRGYVPSIDLQVKLPWDTPNPTGNHVKQLVRRTRRALERLGLADVIESRQGFGYRLVLPAIVEAA